MTRILLAPVYKLIRERDNLNHMSKQDSHKEAAQKFEQLPLFLCLTDLSLHISMLIRRLCQTNV